jgi:two-component system response regulator (stage 0 sporulation protein A)
MSNIEKRIDAVYEYLLAEDSVARSNAHAKLMKLMGKEGSGRMPTDPEAITRDLFLEIGAPDHLQGHEYAITGILLVVENRTFIDNITFGLYPTLAAKYDTTASRIERAIRHLVEVTWTRSDPDVLFKYFGNTVSPDRGKPTNGEFISRCANIVKQRMRLSA